MNQATVGSLLREFFDCDANLRVRVERQEAADENSPDWDRERPDVEMLIQPAGQRDRQAGFMAEFSHPVTHVGFDDGGTNIRVGERLVEQKRHLESGDWQTIPLAERQTYLILSIDRVPGMPAPYAQTHLYLWQMTETRAVSSVG